ncbi:MAG: DNA gyrase subunit A, partial [Rhodobacteraceae bacterium]|nr:DNA gyrase subunit A [Paracoccaceae bacterium]
ISKEGGGKLTSSHEFPAKLNRGGYGVKGNKIKGVIAFMKVTLEDQIILGTNSGQVIRCNVSDVSYRSRSAGGVRIMRLPEDSEIVSVAKIDSSKIPDQEEDQFDEDGSEVSESPVE